VPVYLPEDRAIPAPEVPATASFTREFVPDLEVLQRERKRGVNGLLATAAYLTVLALALSLFALIGWSLLRVDGGGAGRRRAHGGRSSQLRAEPAS
jgi:hypothetical protein